MKPSIGCQVDHDMRHYSFERRSGLPAGYFKPAPRINGTYVIVVCLVIIALLLT